VSAAPRDQVGELLELLENLLGCAIKSDGRWYQIKSNDGKWVDVHEDMQDYLEEAELYLDAYGRLY
jgi:hypothetical protein